MSVTALAPPARIPPLLQVLLLALLTGLASYASLRLTRAGGGVSTLWLSNGLLVGVLVMAPKGNWGRWITAAAVGQLAARLGAGDAAGIALGLLGANLVEAWLIAAWLRRSEGDLRKVGSLGRMAQVALVCVLGACAISATLAVIIAGPFMPTSAAVTWATWFMAHVLGIVMVATLTVCLGQRNIRLLGRPGFRIDYFACVGLLLGIGALSFTQSQYPLHFLAYLPLALLAYRHGLSGMLVGVLLLGTISGVAAVKDAGPFVLMQDSTVLTRLMFWQLYVAGACLLAYPTSLAVTERRRLLILAQRELGEREQVERELAASRAQLQSLADNLPAMVARFDRHQRYTYANHLARRMAGPADPIGRSLLEVRGEETYADLREAVDKVLTGEPQTVQARAEIAGRSYDYRTQFVPDRASDGRVLGFYSMTFDVTQAKEYERQLERLARFDALTGLANRHQFDEAIEAAVGRARRSGQPLLLLSLDVDHFKQINDSLGHAAGDEVLKEFANRLRTAVYDVDLIARNGGDEFAILIEYAPNASVGTMVAERLLEAMAEPMQVAGQALDVSISIGIGVHHPVKSAEQLCALADEALYETKARGRNGWSLREG